jgi:dTDP-4-dehydrorhamnose reductase
MNKILITGASGFLGWNLCRIASENHHVIGTFHNHLTQLPGVTYEKCDITDYFSLKELISKIKPDGVIHTAAISNPNYCQNNPTESRLVNVTASINIAGLCSDLEIPCVFTSTDLVFDGKNPPYNETSAVSPVNLYGEQKLEAEQRMLSIHAKMTICRMPLMFGDVPAHAKSFIQPWIADINSGKTLSLFTDEYRTPVSASDASGGLLLMLGSGNKVIHLGGRSPVSRYEFGILLCEALGKRCANITKALQKDVPMAAPRPLNVSLDSSKAYGLGFNPGDIRDELVKLDCIKAGEK